jgi:CBS domain containing-hemolysin-like protein
MVLANMDAPTAAAAGTGLAIAYTIAGVLLLAINAFFVLSEFAFVKVRESQVAARALAGDARAELLRHVKAHLDEYLSVVQIGITGATIGMGIVIDEGLGRVVEALFTGLGWSGAAANLIAVVISFAVATYLTIVLSELMPKAIAIRHTEAAALIAVRPMRVLHRILYLPILLLDRSARLLLRLCGFRGQVKEIHTEDELRIILGESHGGGVLSFRRLLLFENLFDLGEVRVRDAMRPRAQAQTLPADATREELITAVVAHGFSRYPLVAVDAPADALPVGVVHAKEALARLVPGQSLASISHRFPVLREDQLLEQALAEFQRQRNHLGMVTDAQGIWVGLLAFEDVIEEIVGAIEDEFEREQPLHLDQLLDSRRIHLDLQANGIDDAIVTALGALESGVLPSTCTAGEAARLLLERERSLSTAIGRGIAIPHARIEDLERPIASFVRFASPQPIPGRRDDLRFLFILLEPSGSQRLHLRLLARIARIADSDYLLERLAAAHDAPSLLEAVAAGDRIAAG